MDRYQDFLFNEEFIKWRLFGTPEQDSYWHNFITQNPQLEQAINEAIIKFNSSVSFIGPLLNEEDKREIYNKVILRANFHNRRKRYIQRISAIAAILILGLTVTYTILKTDDRLPDSSSLHITGQALPDEDVYIISGDQKVKISNRSDIEMTANAKAIITDTTNSKKELGLASVAINKLVVPYGKRSSLTLSDGTKIWINSGTQIAFPTKFSGKTREIYVNGEIYIDVAKDLKREFIIHTTDMDVKVHGTTFNLSAYHDDDISSVVLVEGKVTVKAGDQESLLLPNERLELSNNSISKEIVDVTEYTSWVKGVLIFNETSIDDILKKIGRYYNVKFEDNMNSALYDKTCSGKLFLSSNIDSVLTSISAISSLQYCREDDIIHIIENQQ